MECIIAPMYGTSITFKNIKTQTNGRNAIYLLRSSQGNNTTQTVFENITYGAGGETEFLVGVRGPKDGTVDSPIDVFTYSRGAKISLKNDGQSHNLAMTIDRSGTTTGTGINLTIGSGKINSSDYFLGEIEYLAFENTLSNGTFMSYTVNKNATFVANLKKAASTTTVQPNKGLLLRDGAKAILSFHEGFNNQLDFTKVGQTGGGLTLTSSTNVDSNLLLNTDQMSGTVLDIASLADNSASKAGYNHDIRTIYQRRTTARTVTFESVKFEGDGSGTPLVRLFVGQGQDGAKYADKVTIKSVDSTGNSTNRNINTQIFLAPELIGKDLTSDNLIVFKAPSEVRVQNQQAITGDIVYTVELTENNQSDNSEWKIGKVGEGHIATSTSEYLASALGINYNLFVQNINSLNKRMGELRGNDNQQGVWARVFTGKQSSTMDFIPVDSYYTTIQGGYDYGISVDGGKNYTGVSLAYSYGSSESSKDFNSISISGFSGKTNTVEVGVYNSYIQDEGWFSDSIMKFSYFMSSFDITQIKGNITADANNFGFTLGEEFGYRFALGENKNWFIDPQAELVVGYLGNSDLVNGSTTASLEDIFLFRGRVGSDFGYSLKTNENQYDFRLGLGYEYDVANGGVSLSNTLQGKTYTSNLNNAIENDGRVVLNVGTNMKFGENMRLYFDFEKSFAGKITTDYQVNVGFRYGFGEKLVKVVEEANTQEKAPLKIENTQTQEQPQTPAQPQNQAQ